MKLIKYAVFGLFVILLSAVALATGDEYFKEVPGKRYKYDGKKVEVIEFLSFYCSHCYAFESEIPKIKGNFPKKLTWQVYPIYWGDGSSPKPGEAYFLALDAGKGEEMKKEIFNALFVDKKDIGNISVLEELGNKIGLGFDFSRKLRSGYKRAEANDALNLSSEFMIDGTPGIIVAGNRRVQPAATYVIKVIETILWK